MSSCWAASLEHSGAVQRQGLHVGGNIYIWHFAIIKNLCCVVQVLLGKVKNLFWGFVSFIRLPGIWESSPPWKGAGWVGYAQESTHRQTPALLSSAAAGKPSSFISPCNPFTTSETPASSGKCSKSAWYPWKQGFASGTGSGPWCLQMLGRNLELFCLVGKCRSSNHAGRWQQGRGGEWPLRLWRAEGLQLLCGFEQALQISPMGQGGSAHHLCRVCPSGISGRYTKYCHGIHNHTLSHPEPGLLAWGEKVKARKGKRKRKVKERKE